MTEPSSTNRLPQDDAVAYEVAREALGQLVGYAASRIDQEAAKPTPDEVVLATWRQRRDEWSATRAALDPYDTATVRTVLRDANQLLRSLPSA